MRFFSMEFGILRLKKFTKNTEKCPVSQRWETSSKIPGTAPESKSAPNFYVLFPMVYLFICS